MKTSHDKKRLVWADEDYRYAYAEDFLNTWIATQVVTLREQRGLSQAALGRLIGTKQPGVSRLEDVNHSTWKTETLKRIARALGVRLKISFETFGSLVDEDDSFHRSYLKRPTFDDDPAFDDSNIPTLNTDITLTSRKPAGLAARSTGAGMGPHFVGVATTASKHSALPNAVSDIASLAKGKGLSELTAADQTLEGSEFLWNYLKLTQGCPASYGRQR